MSRRRLPTDEGVDERPASQHGGTYPPDVARRRRQLGLPITAAEHVAYERGEMRAPPATVAQMQRTLRDVGPRCSPFLRKMLEDIAARQATRLAKPGREPGEEG